MYLPIFFNTLDGYSSIFLIKYFGAIEQNRLVEYFGLPGFFFFKIFIGGIILLMLLDYARRSLNKVKYKFYYWFVSFCFIYVIYLNFYLLDKGA